MGVPKVFRGWPKTQNTKPKNMADKTELNLDPYSKKDQEKILSLVQKKLTKMLESNPDLQELWIKRIEDEAEQIMMKKTKKTQNTKSRSNSRVELKNSGSTTSSVDDGDAAKTVSKKYLRRIRDETEMVHIQRVRDQNFSLLFLVDFRFQHIYYYS